MFRQGWYLLLVNFVCAQGIRVVIDTITQNYNEIYNYNINSTSQTVLIYPKINITNPFRVRAWSTDATPQYPVLVVVQQEKQVTSWLVPLMVETTQRDSVLNFMNTSKTMCHDQMDSVINQDFSIGTLTVSQSFIVALSTASRENVNINIALEEETEFYVKTNQNYSLSVSPSEPRYVFYKLQENTSDTVVIEVDSEDDICLTVSVQDSRCPVFDMNKDIKYEGIYQTINLKGAITVWKHKYPFGFFLVFVAKPDNFDCSQENSYIPRTLRNVQITPLNRTSKINFTIKNGLTARDYLVATLTTLVSLAITGVILFVGALVMNRFGTISKNKYDDVVVADYFGPLSDDQVNKLLQTKKLTVANFARHPKRIKRRSYNYLSHILSIALFYSIPVVQLVVTYQRTVNQTGNEDMCYYNFLCAHPALGFSDFNHIYSNIGYVIFGIIFILVVMDRHTIIKIRKEKGIPVHYGIYHAMGVALIIEGLLSGCYHICPSQSNYQFDTSFMYIMAVLIMVKLYQNRHPDINATAYSTFTVLGAAIFMAMVGILNGSLAVWIIFVVCYTILCVVLSFKIYFLNYILDGLKQLRSELKRKGVCVDAFKPIRRAMFILLVIANLANYTMLITGLCLYTIEVTDFGTFLLGLLMGNSVIHAIFYTAMKLIHKERICMEATFFGLLGIATWAASGVFFLDAATLWTVTAAESRQWNQGCIFLSFFDKHDVWHFLSAPALYFTFMFLMHLDDDIVDKHQSEIPVF